jgi:chromosome segregation protein
MRLKRLTVQGFKSFADQTHFDFESSLTGIVGPNGCGKSNVVDALKWVLGDQRARSLRGKEMTDVIFKGAEGRDGSHQAEVMVTLVDDGDQLGGRTEVTVGRRLNKDKESDYLLNGDRVRLKDVRDVLMDTGLGVGAYSVMEQGRIDAVLSANPEDRRAIFEEAAGISRFKLQKRETLRSLDRTEQNLERVKDLLEERHRRIRSLKIQAGKARRYQELRSELRDMRTAMAVLEARDLRTSLEEKQEILESLTAELAGVEARCLELEEARNVIDTRIDTRSQEYESLQEHMRGLESQRDAAEQQARSEDHRAEDQRGHAADSRRQIAELTDQHADKIAERQSVRDRVSALEGDLSVLSDSLGSKKDDLKSTQAKVRELSAEREGLRQRMLEWMNERTRTRNLAHGKQTQLSAQLVRSQGLGQRYAGLDVELDGFEFEIGALSQALAVGQRETETLQAEEQSVLAELDAADAAVAELAREESELRQQMSSVHGRLQVLSDMESHLEGLDQGPRYLLEKKPAGLQGRLADLLDADLEYSAALEAALGPFVQALIVDSREHANAMHAMLRKEGKGRAILLIDKEIPDDLLRGSQLFTLPVGAKSLLDHVRYPGYSRCLVHWLLRGVCVVESLDQADSDRHDLCYVTAEGGLVCGPRIEGGSKEGQGGLIVRKATILTLQSQASALEAQLDSLLSGKQEVAEQVMDLNGEARSVGEMLQTVRVRDLGRGSQRESLLARVKTGERDLEGLTLEIRDLDAQGSLVRVELNDLLMRAFHFGRLEAREVDHETQITADLATAQVVMEEAGREEQAVELRLVECRRDREAAREACRLHDNSLRDLQMSTDGFVERERESLASAASHEVVAVESRKAVAAMSDALEEGSAKRDLAATALAGAREEFAECKSEFLELQSGRSATAQSITDVRLAVGENEHRFDWLETRLRDDVGITLRRCLGEVDGFGLVIDRPYGPIPGPEDVLVLEIQGPVLDESLYADELSLTCIWDDDDFDVDACGRDVKVTQARIDRLGSVNLAAVEELAEEQSDLTLTEQEVKDLNESRTGLIEALRRMEHESRILFEETFKKARDNFQTIFRKLFQGGRADMYLSTEEDSLEGGIEVMARPPGKELQSIDLLSGGERTLTALAILFAVFKVKPSPFCILDEVDAALDDTNVERFLRVLDDFVGPTQFCVVTHHKRTMAACNSLYGVTMQRRGVSSRIAVNLEEVEELSGTGLKGDGAANGADTAATKHRVAGEEALGF